MNTSTGNVSAIIGEDFHTMTIAQVKLIGKLNDDMDQEWWTGVLCDAQKIIDTCRALEQAGEIDHMEAQTLNYYNDFIKIKLEAIQKIRDLKEKYGRTK